VHVVTTGVHHAVGERGKRDSTLLLDWQCVNVGAHHDAIAGLGADEARDGPGARRATPQLEAEIEKPSRDDVGRPVLLKGKFRVSVQVVSKRNRRGIRLIEECRQVVGEASGHRGMVVSSSSSPTKDLG